MASPAASRPTCRPAASRRRNSRTPGEGTYSDPCTLQWLSDALAPNVTPDSDTIVLADVYVAWYSAPDPQTPLSLTCNGGHVLCPLTVDLDGKTLTLNNPWPPSFEHVSSSPTNGLQTVKILPVPAKYTLGQPDTGGGFSWVVNDWLVLNGSFPVVNGADIFAISSKALPGPGYVPQTWEIPDTINQSKMQTIDTNGGTLTVLAPLAGRGGLYKGGEGQLLLTNSNALTGWLWVNGGSVATQLTSGTPLGLGPILLGNGGTLVLSPNASTLSVQIASGENATLAVGAGGGVLQLQSTGVAKVMIGAYADATTPNLTRTDAGTLILQPSQGVSLLYTDQLVLVAGTADNLPQVANGMVEPWMLGQDNDAAGSGAFLSYDDTYGFVAATVAMSDVQPINSATASMIYQVTPNDTQTITTGQTVQVAALEMDGGTIDASGAILQVGGQAASGFAGLVLNGGPISGGTLSFGASEAVVMPAPTRSAIPSRRP
jgi:hypothetical protein